MISKSSCSHTEVCFALACPAFSWVVLYDAVLKISATCLLCQTRLHCVQSHHLPVPWPYWDGCVSGGVGGSWGIPWRDGVYVGITNLHGRNEEMGVLATSCANLQESEGNLDFSPRLNAAQRHSTPRLRRSFPWSLAWLCSLRHTSTTRNICPSFMQSVSITNNYLSPSFFLLCWLLA